MPLFNHSTISFHKTKSHKTMFSFSTAEEVKSAANATGVVFLDVRNDYEIQDSKLTSRPFLNVTCTPMDCSELTAKASELLPDKDGTFDNSHPFHPRRLDSFNNQPPLLIRFLVFSFVIIFSTRDYLLRIRSSCGQGQGDLGRNGIHYGTECR